MVGFGPPMTRPTPQGMAPIGPPMPVPCNRPLTLNQDETRAEHARRTAACAQQADWTKRLEAATGREQIAGILETGADILPDHTVEKTFKRLHAAGALGPPTHDLLDVEVHWLGKMRRQRAGQYFERQRLIFRELRRRPGWLAADGQPVCFREGTDSLTETRARMDVWIDAEGRTFRRERVYRGGPGTSREDHDSQLTTDWEDPQSRPKLVAVPVGEPPRTVEEKGFLLPRKTTALRATILLTSEGSYGSHSLEHRLAHALATVLRRR
jgi:hypothetical protein